MIAEQTLKRIGCKHHTQDQQPGFRLVSPRKGDIYEGTTFGQHTFVFLLEGEGEFSYNQFLNRHFRSGDLFFIPQAAYMYGTALEDCHLLVLTISPHDSVLCENGSLSKCALPDPSMNYDFAPVSMPTLLRSFALQVESYICSGVQSDDLYSIKQSEFFVLLQCCCTKEQLLRILHPILTQSSFSSLVLRYYKPGVTLAELAVICNMSIKSFSRRFAKQFGVNYRTWVLQQKVMQIQLQLSKSDTTTADVIRDFSFTDYSHFYRFCKENYGYAPTELKAILKS